MAGEQIPEAWIGWQVTLTHWNGDRSSLSKGSLEAVNDRGIVLATEEIDNEEPYIRFYPWSAVLQIQQGVGGF